ncbi:MAG: GH25 family lysozyme, partial [Acidobacteriota bacterium]
LKATEGIDAADATFADDWRDAARVGLLRGAYHFYEPPDDPLEQARFFLDTVGPLGPGDLPPVLDVEVRRGVDADAVLAGVRAWLQAVEAATGRRAMVYTGVNFWNALDSKSADRAAIADRALWVASYRQEPALPDDWAEWTFWQYTERATVPGIEREVDLNRFSGSLEDLERLAELPAGS